MSKQVDIVIVKRAANQPSQQISMRLPLDTTFEEIVKFLNSQGFIKCKNVTVRPHHNPAYAIGLDRKISDCYNIIELKFIVEEISGKSFKMVNAQALQEEGLIKEKESVLDGCGKMGGDNCQIM